MNSAVVSVPESAPAVRDEEIVSVAEAEYVVPEAAVPAFVKATSVPSKVAR